MRKLRFLVLAAVVASLVLAQYGYHLYALALVLFSSIALLSVSEEGGARAKIFVTFSLGAVALFIFICEHGIPAAEGLSVLNGFTVLSHNIH
jgi:hypothetical protein